MGLGGALLRALTYASYRRRYGGTWTRILLEHEIPRPEGARADGSDLVLPTLGLRLTKPDAASLTLLRGLRFAVALCRRAGATVMLRDDHVDVLLDGLRMSAYCAADLGVMCEVFVERLYRFEMPGRFLVIDIGANIGASALFFARHYDAIVESFELVPSSAAIAAENIKQNPELAGRIQLHGYGLADQELEREICVNVAFRPSNSFYSPVETKGATREMVRVRDVAAVFAELAPKRQGRRLVVKLDAEGAEYEIVRRLAGAGLLGEIDLLFLEWHDREGDSPDDLRCFLREAGFSWFENEHHEAPVGMITAFR